MKKVLTYIWELPMSIFIIGYHIYAIIMTFIQSDAVSIELMDDDDFSKFIDDKVSEFKTKFKPMLHAVSFCYWTTSAFAYYKLYLINF